MHLPPELYASKYTLVTAFEMFLHPRLQSHWAILCVLQVTMDSSSSGEDKNRALVKKNRRATFLFM
jgi:hypothetical protein